MVNGLLVVLLAVDNLLKLVPAAVPYVILCNSLMFEQVHQTTAVAQIRQINIIVMTKLRNNYSRRWIRWFRKSSRFS